MAGRHIKGREAGYIRGDSEGCTHGGYHHIGTNNWQGAGAPPPPPDTTGLRYFTVVLPDGDELARLVAGVEQAGSIAATTNEGVLLTADPAEHK